MADLARPMSGGVVHVDTGDEPGIGKAAIRLLIFAIAGAIVMPWVAYRSLNRYDMLRMPVTAAAAGAAVSSANVVGEAAKAVKETATVALGAVSKVNLPDGTELTATPRGLESQIINFLTDTSGTSANEASFDCDRVIFDAGTANLQATSTDQLQNVAKILKAYRTTSVQIDGYADTTGTKAEQQKLSTQRAKSVAARLASLGVSPTRMSANGNGYLQSAIANAAQEAPGNNAQVSLVLTRKTQ
jgi:K(+)-stimulated pyrophosphate-energized sodium pump